VDDAGRAAALMFFSPFAVASQTMIRARFLPGRLSAVNFLSRRLPPRLLVMGENRPQM
jgi:hypothetical protein